VSPERLCKAVVTAGRRRTQLSVCMFAALAWGISGALAAKADTAKTDKAEAKAGQKARVAKPRLDHSGKKQKGKASYYSRKFTGKKMADGTPMDPQSNAAASKTLPLGTKARVTNLRNGRSAEVEIRDRGPFVEGRTVDVTPRTARELGMTSQGVAPVEVAPLSVPQPDGSVKPGAGARPVQR
jgi:rare lipoprotein A